MMALLTLLAMVLMGVIAIGMVFAVLGVVLSITFGLVGFLLFKVAPILLIGWVVVKMLGRSGCRHRISAADRRWLDGEA